MKIKNFEELVHGETKADTEARTMVLESIEKAIEAVDPVVAVRRNVEVSGDELRIGSYKINLKNVGRIIVVGGGKASGRMAEAIESILGDKIESGIVNVLKGTESLFKTERIMLNPAGHPIPTEEGVKGVKAMLSLLEGLTPRDIVITLISGGGSALMPYPLEEISIEDYVKVNRLLLKSGADINEINAVRKHLSRIKGGWLAKYAYPATVFSLIISDVVGDPLETIASGPTSPDPYTFADAYNVLKKYSLIDKVPENVLNVLQDGLSGKLDETPKPGDKVFEKVRNIIVASNSIALNEMVKHGMLKGYECLNLSSYIEGEAREVGKVLACIARGVDKAGSPIERPALIVGGGETTVHVVGEGLGGRNQEVVLGAVEKLSNIEGCALCSIGTDGIDGITDAAGALADGKTYERGLEMNLRPEDYLRVNDSYNYFKKVGGLVFTGPTLTNVADIFVIALPPINT